MQKRDSNSRSYKRRLLRLEPLESRELLSAVPTVSLVAETFKPEFDYTGKMAVSGTFSYQGYSLPFTGSAKAPLPTGTADFSTSAALGSFTMDSIQGDGTWTAPAHYDYGSFTFTNGHLEGTSNNGPLTSGTGTFTIDIYGHGANPYHYHFDLDLGLTGSFNAATQKFSFHGADPNHTDISLNMTGTIAPNASVEPFGVSVNNAQWTTLPDNSSALQVGVDVSGPVRLATSYTAPVAKVALYWGDAGGKAIGKALAPTLNIGWNEATGTYNITGLPVPPANAASVLLVPQFDGKTGTPVTVPLPARPTLSVDNVQVTPLPGTNVATFTVTLSQASTFPVTVAYATANGTAISGTDYTAAAKKTLTFAPGDPLSKTVTIAVKPNAKATGDRLFYLNLTGPTWATIGSGQGKGTCTITPFAHPSISVDNVQVTPTPQQTKTTFTITLSKASPFPVSVVYATVNGTAVSGTDYTAKKKTTLTFAPGAPLSQTVTIDVKPNAKATGDRLFYLNLTSPTWATIDVSQGKGTCTITPYAHPSVSIENDIEVSRPNAGTVTATFNLILSAASPFPVSVTYATANGSAVSSSDYTALSNKTVTFAANVTSMPVAVVVKANAKATADKNFFLNLKSAVWASIGDNQGICTIKPYTPPVSSSLLQPLASYFDATTQRKSNTTILPTVLDAILAKSGV